MKNVLFILVFGFSFLKAECEILGMKLNQTSKAEIIKNYKHFKENGKKANDLLNLDPLQFEIPELESVVLDFNKNNRVVRVGLEYSASLPQYIILKKFLDNKYMTGQGNESYDEQGYFAHFYYKQKIQKNVLFSFILMRINIRGFNILTDVFIKIRQKKLRTCWIFKKP